MGERNDQGRGQPSQPGQDQFRTERFDETSATWTVVETGSWQSCESALYERRDGAARMRVVNANGDVEDEVDELQQRADLLVRLRASIEQARLVAEECLSFDSLDEEDHFAEVAESVATLLNAAAVAHGVPRAPAIKAIVEAAMDLDPREMLGVKDFDPGKYVVGPRVVLDSTTHYAIVIVNRTGDKKASLAARALNALSLVAFDGDPDEERATEAWARSINARARRGLALPARPRDKKAVATHLLPIASHALDEVEHDAQRLTEEGHGWLDILVGEAQRLRPDLSRGFAAQEAAFRKLQDDVRKATWRYDNDPEALVRATARAIGMPEGEVQALFDADRKAVEKLGRE